MPPPQELPTMLLLDLVTERARGWKSERANWIEGRSTTDSWAATYVWERNPIVATHGHPATLMATADERWTPSICDYYIQEHYREDPAVPEPDRCWSSDYHLIHAT